MRDPYVCMTVFSAFLSALGIVKDFYFGYSNRCVVVMVLMANDTECLMCFFGILIVSHQDVCLALTGLA